MNLNSNFVLKYFIISIIAGILFGFMDALIHANALAEELFEVYEPISKEAVNVAAGIIIDLVYGFLLTGIFLILYRSLPGHSGICKGIFYAVILWFLRVLMNVVSSWMTQNIPFSTILYILLTGLVEMLVLGILFGLTLKRE